MLNRFKTAIPLLLGSAVCIALTNTLCTVLFNAGAWIAIGSGVSMANAYASFYSTPLFVFLTFLAQAFACAMGEFTTASFAKRRPYFNALGAGAMLITWDLVMYCSPFTFVQSSSLALLINFVPPIPMSIIGASIWFRTYGTR